IVTSLVLFCCTHNYCNTLSLRDNEVFLFLLMVNQGCLTGNRYKSESLPQMRNRYENLKQYPPVRRATGGGNEVNDEGAEEGSGNRGASVSEGAKKGQGHYSE